MSPHSGINGFHDFTLLLAMTFVVPNFLCDFLWVSYRCRRQNKRQGEKEKKKKLTWCERSQQGEGKTCKRKKLKLGIHIQRRNTFRYYMSVFLNLIPNVCVARLCYTCFLYWKLHWQLNVGNNTARDQALCFQLPLNSSCSLSHFLSFPLALAFSHTQTLAWAQGKNCERSHTSQIFF